jgi:hypothetical protein
MNKKLTVTVKQTPPLAIEIRGEVITLDAFLKLAGAVETGGQHHARQKAACRGCVALRRARLSCDSADLTNPEKHAIL